MSLGESIRKLMEGNNEQDLELAAFLLESDEFSMEEKKAYIEKFISENPQQFTEKELKFLRIWLGSKKEKDNKTIQKLQLWILKDH